MIADLTETPNALKRTAPSGSGCKRGPSLAESLNSWVVQPS